VSSAAGHRRSALNERRMMRAFGSCNDSLSSTRICIYTARLSEAPLTVVPAGRQTFAATVCAIGFSMASCRPTSGTPYTRTMKIVLPFFT
jgi:hypothetical protein